MTAEGSKELAILLKKLRAQHAKCLPAADADPGMTGASSLDPGEPILGLFVRSFLLWDAPTPKALAAMQRLERSVVDFNDLRVCLADELSHAIGERYPRSGERALRLRSALNSIYVSEHLLSLEHLVKLPKRQAHEYLSGLEGTPPFVVARVMLLALGAHAAPVDDRIAHGLCEAGVIRPDASPADAASLIERTVHAGELPEVYSLLQAMADEAGVPGPEHDNAPRVAVRPAGKTDASSGRHPSNGEPARKPRTDRPPTKKRPRSER